MIARFENGLHTNPDLSRYADPDSPQYAQMVDEIRRELKFTTLKYHRLDDMIASTGMSPCKFCTYCWTGKE
jgi:amidophosphoribosyltransferase